MSEKDRPARERILDAALAILGNSGVRTLAQPRVARDAGVPQGHLTYDFPKRLDLLEAVAARFVERLTEELPSLPALASDARARIDAAGRRSAMRFIGKTVKDRARSRTVIGLLAAADEEPALRSAMAARIQSLRALVAKLVDKPVTDPDVDLALATLWGIGILHLSLKDRSAAETDRLLARFAERLEHN